MKQFTHFRQSAILLAILLLPGTLGAQENQFTSFPDLEDALFQEEPAGNPTAAIELYRKLIDQGLPPGQLEIVYRRLADLLADVGRLDESKAVFQQLKAAFPESRHLAEIDQRLGTQVDTAELFRRVSLLGLWASTAKDGEDSSPTSTNYLEFMPGNRYQRLPHPLDASPGQPLEQGTYEVDKDRLEMQSGTEKRTYKWTVRQDQLLLEGSDGAKISRVRARRPFRFPRQVAEPRQVAALLNLKAAEARSVRGYLEDSMDTTGAADLLASSGPVDSELLQMTNSTTAELFVDTGLNLLDLATDLLETGEVDRAKSVLDVIEELHWNHRADSDDLGAFLGSYGTDVSTIRGAWEGIFPDDERPIEMSFHLNGHFEFPDLEGEFEEPRYHISKNRLGFAEKGGIPDEWYLFLMHRNSMVLYHDTGTKAGWMRRRDAGLQERDLWHYFNGYHGVLYYLSTLSFHASIRKRLLDYHHDVATMTEGTTSGLLARTALRQLVQLDAAQQAGDLGKATAILAAFEKTEELLMSRTLASTINSVGFTQSPNDDRAVENPFHSAYDSSFLLTPIPKVRPDIQAYQKQAERLRQHLLDENVVRLVLDRAPSTIQDRFFKSFGDLSSDEVITLLERNLTVAAESDPLNVFVAAFPHDDPIIAATLGNQLAEVITTLPAEEGQWQWQVAQPAQDSALPFLLFLPEDPPQPAHGRSTHGKHPRELYDRFVYEVFIEPFDNGHRSCLSNETFLLLRSGEEVFALRSEGPTSWEKLPKSLPLTLVTPNDEGNVNVEVVKATRSDPPFLSLEHAGLHIHCGIQSDSFPRLMRQNRVNSLMRPNQPSLPGPVVFVPFSEDRPISVARTTWTNPEDIRFDDLSLRWYALLR